MSDPLHPPNNATLLAYLDEMLSIEESHELEQRLRTDTELRVRLMALLQQRDQGAHTVGEIWRRHRLSCPERSQLREFSRGVASAGMADYIQFHLTVGGCRICQANLTDLIEEPSSEETERRRRYFDSSAGFLSGRPGE